MSLSNQMNVYTIAKLKPDGSNWVTYKSQTLAYLGARGVRHHVDGTVRVPPPVIALTKPTAEEEAAMEAAEAKIDEYNQREDVVKQQLFSTIYESLHLKIVVGCATLTRRGTQTHNQQFTYVPTLPPDCHKPGAALQTRTRKPGGPSQTRTRIRQCMDAL